MEAEDEAAPYLKFFNEGSHNYLLQSSEDGLNDSFPVESIFTQITSDWSTEGFPILLSGPLVTEDENNDSESASNNIHVLSEENEGSNVNEDSNSENTLTFFSNVDKNRIVLANDVLLRIEDDENPTDNTITHVINGDTYSITYEPVSEETETADKEESVVEVIQLVNVDGTVTNINKDLLNIVETQDKNNIDNYYSEVKAYKCKLCPFLSEVVEDMQSHIISKHVQNASPNNVSSSNSNKCSADNIVGTKMKSILNVSGDKKRYVVFFCSECGNGYSNKDSLKNHMVTQHHLVCDTSADSGSGPNMKNITPKSSDPEDIKQKAHKVSVNLLKKQKSSKKIKCSIKGCPFKFSRDEFRKRHEDCHVNQQKKQFMCPECKEKFSIWRICNMHLWKCHKVDLGLLTCPMCNQFKANSTVKIINHMRIHNEEKPFVCSSCGKRFKQITQLRNHEIAHKPPEEAPNWSTLKKCEFCDRAFANSKSLKKHIKFVHDKFKPFICNICGHQTSRKEMLQIHYRQHTGDKPFHCSYCDYKTADRNCLRKHTMRHFGETKYSCPYCDFQSIQTSTYKMHIANKHPGKEGAYACTTCNYTTVNAQSYAAHVKCHGLEQQRKEAKGKADKDAEKNVANGDKETKADESSKSSNLIEDDETQNFLNTEHSEDVVDTGGITIPAEFDLQLTKD